MRAVILAGGKGTRLMPYTTVLPKPLMPIGDMPILEVVLRQLKAAGVTRVTMAVGHLAELLQAFFGDGKRLRHPDRLFDRREGARHRRSADAARRPRRHVRHDERRHSYHARLSRPARASTAKAVPLCTIATYVRNVKIDFGVIEADAKGILTGYVEKPNLDYRVSMGIYVFEPAALAYLKKGEYRDFPDLVKALIADGKKVASYAFTGYWLDMGRADDYARAIEEFESRRSEFLPGEA